MKKYFTIALVKELVLILYTKVLRPMAVEYVESTENTHDDKALVFLDDFVNEHLKAKKDV